MNLGSTFLALGKLVMAEECFQKVLSVSKNTVTDPKDELLSYYCLATTQISQER